MMMLSSILLLPLLLKIGQSANSNCIKSITINSQDDADYALKGCDYFEGNIRIGTKASGHLVLREPRFINASISNDVCESCSPHTASIDSLSFSQNARYVYNLTLQGLPALKKIDLGGINHTIIFHLDNLPELQHIDTKMVQGHKVILQDLAKLDDFTLGSDHLRFGYDELDRRANADNSTLAIDGVGLRSVDNLLSRGDFCNVIDIKNIPKVYSMTFAVIECKSAFISGNGHLAFDFDYGDEAKDIRGGAFGHVVLAGISSLTDHSNEEWKISAASVVFQDTNLQFLDMPFSNLRNFTARRNPKLRGIGGKYWSSTNYLIETLTIQDNPQLILRNEPHGQSHVTNFTADPASARWTYPYHVFDAVLQGPIENSFFDYYRLVPGVAFLNLNVTSTIHGFKCRRTLGDAYLVGDSFICQGKVISKATFTTFSVHFLVSSLLLSIWWAV